MWNAEENKKQKFRVVLEVEFPPTDKVEERTVAKITQRVLDEYKAAPSMIHPDSFKVIQVEEEK